MKTGQSIIRLAWVLLGILAVGAAVILLGHPSSNEAPYATSFDPGGAAAFAELLRRQGYQVSIEDSIPSETRRDTLTIAFLDRDGIGLDPDAANKAEEDAPTKSDKSSEPDDESPFKAILPRASAALIFVSGQMRAGQNAMVLGYAPNAKVGELKTNDISIADPTNRTYHVTDLQNVSGVEALFAASVAFDAWSGDGGVAFGTVNSMNGGKVVVIPKGEIAMNALIDQADNAKFLMDAVRLVAPPTRKIRIIDGAVSGAGSAGLIEILGPWAHGIELQLVLLALVIVYSLGKRFGIADETPRVQPSARDLLDGIADTYGRARAAKAALQQLVKDADRSVRRQLKLASDAPPKKRNEILPPSVAQALIACEHAIAMDPTPQMALELARRLETELEVFLPRRRFSAIRRRRRVKSA